MSLATAQKQGPPRRRHTASVCSVTQLIDTLPPAEATALRDMLRAKDAIGRWAWTAAELESLIERETRLHLGQHVIARHRRQDCLCDPDRGA